MTKTLQADERTSSISVSNGRQLRARAQAMLRAERGSHLQIAQGGECIQRMRQIGRDGSGMCEQCDTAIL